MRLRSSVAVLSLAAVLAGGCRPAPVASLPPAFTEQDLIGAWTMAFEAGNGTLPLVFAELVISGQHDPQHPGYLAARFTADFHPMLGRQISCLQSPQASLVQLQDSVTVQLVLTPEAADCGLFATGTRGGTAFTGEWAEPGITGQPQANGTFTMWRRD